MRIEDDAALLVLIVLYISIYCVVLPQFVIHFWAVSQFSPTTIIKNSQCVIKFVC